MVVVVVALLFVVVVVVGVVVVVVFAVVVVAEPSGGGSVGRGMSNPSIRSLIGRSSWVPWRNTSLYNDYGRCTRCLSRRYNGYILMEAVNDDKLS